MKIIKLLLTIFIAFILTITIYSKNINALDNPSLADMEKITETQEKLLSAAEEFQKSETKTEALKRLWSEQISNTLIGKAIITTEKMFKKLNPLFLIIPKIEFSWSITFFLAIIFAIVVFTTTKTFVSIIDMNKIIIYLIALIITVILSILGIFKFLATTINSTINLIDNLFVQFIMYIILIFLMIFLEKAALRTKQALENKMRLKGFITKKVKQEIQEQSEEQTQNQKKEEGKIEEKKKEEELEEEYGKKLLRRLGERLLSREPQIKPMEIEVERTEKPI
ncbi:MAG: hypothetical protein N3D20_02500 [Candidatus Pacearchaeota archaeon]|nr:hypothetical protein [Candidatus Pacearchaeota archaeon]